MSTIDHGSPIIVALDYPAQEQAMALVEQLVPGSCRLKIGLELFNLAGPELVSRIMDRGFEVFLDLKFHDIPNTVARACSAAAQLGVWMMNIHCMGGPRMMLAAREAIDLAQSNALLLGVTVLTSHAEHELVDIGFAHDTETLVRRLAKLAHEAGLDGVVCSPHEAQSLRQLLGNDFCLVTPGVRPAGTDHQDQRRVMTPSEALAAGSDYLVIGRPITAAADPKAALDDIASSIA